MIGLLNRAAELKTPLQIIYINKDNQISQRVIKVLAITDTSIKSYCFTKRQFQLVLLAKG